MGVAPTRSEVLRLDQLHIRNYRVLGDLRMKKLAPLVTLVGPNGCGKSTMLDALAFLGECLTGGLRDAWARRGGMEGLRTLGADGPISYELRYREAPGERLMTYHLAIDEQGGRPFVASEWLRLTVARPGARDAACFMAFERGEGHVMAVEGAEVVPEALASPEGLALDVLGQLARYPRMSALRRFLAGWRLYDLDPDAMRRPPRSGAEALLSPNGDNLANVLLHLQEDHPELLEEIVFTMGFQVPHFVSIKTVTGSDGRLDVCMEDAPHGMLIPSRAISDGTLQTLAFLVLFFCPSYVPFMGFDEPEKHIHPSLLDELAERFGLFANEAQLFMATQSPSLLNRLTPEQVWVLYRGASGHTIARRTIEMLGTREGLEQGFPLGELWTRGHFRVGNPRNYSVGTASSPDRLDRYSWSGHRYRMVSEDEVQYKPESDREDEGQPG